MICRNSARAIFQTALTIKPTQMRIRSTTRRQHLAFTWRTMVFKYLLDNGGLKAQEARTIEKGALLHDAIDTMATCFTAQYQPTIAP